MKNKILGTIEVVWGGALLITGLMKNTSEASGAYASGQTVGLIFGGILLVAGIYTFTRNK